MVSGHRVMCPKPWSWHTATISFKKGKAMFMASSRVRFMRAPEWMTTRVAPIWSATRQLEVI